MGQEEISQQGSAVSMEQFRANREMAKLDKVGDMIKTIDQATRDMHASASAAMKIAFLMRQELGLPLLPRP